MQSQEELLTRPAPPPLPIGGDSGPILPDLGTSSSEGSGVEGAAADTTPRIDRSHRLPAAQDATLAEQPASDFATDGDLLGSLDTSRAGPAAEDSGTTGSEKTESAQPAVYDSAEGAPEELNDPLQRLMEATDRRPIFDEPELTAGGLQPEPEQRRFEENDENPLGGAPDEGAGAESSGDHDAVLERLMGGAEERPEISDLLGDFQEETEREPDLQEVLEPLESSQQETSASPDFSVQELLDRLGPPQPPAVDAATVHLTEMGEGTLDFSEELMPPVAPDEHAWHDAAEGSGGSVDLATPWRIHEPAIASYEGAPPTAPETFDSIAPCRPQGIVAGDRTATFSGPGTNWLTIGPYFAELSVPVFGQVEDFAGHEAVDDTVVPAFQVSVPSFDARPVYSTGLAAWLSRVNETPDTSEMRDVPVGSWQPDMASGKPQGIVAEGRTETLSGPVAKLVTIEPHFSGLSASVFEPIEDFARHEAVGETVFRPLQVSVPSFDVQPVHSAGLAAWSSRMNETPDLIGTLDAPGSWQPEGGSARASAPSISPIVPNPGTGFAGSTSVLFGLRPIEWTSLRLTAVTLRFENACEVEPVEVAENLNSPSSGYRVPGFTIVPIPGESCRQGITLADMLCDAKPEAGVNPEARLEQGVPAVANWTGSAEQPRRNIGVPTNLLTGAIRGVRQFPQFGYLLMKSGAGEALMQGMQPWDTAGILPVLAINEWLSQPEPFSVLQLESPEAALDAIGPAAAIYAPADLDPCEYAYYGG